MVTVVGDTVHPASVSVWMRPPVDVRPGSDP